MCRWAKLNVVKKRGWEGVLAKQFYINSPHSFLIEFKVLLLPVFSGIPTDLLFLTV